MSLRESLFGLYALQGEATKLKNEQGKIADRQADLDQRQKELDSDRVENERRAQKVSDRYGELVDSICRSVEERHGARVVECQTTDRITGNVLLISINPALEGIRRVKIRRLPSFEEMLGGETFELPEAV